MKKSEPVVFVIDDDEAVLESLSLMIETVGLKVQTYSSAKEFLDDHDPAQSGCLVLDVRMPGMSGLELLSQLTNQEFSISVIIITGHGDVPMAVQALKAGAVDFIEKPFREQVLLDSIQKAIKMDAENRCKQIEQTDIKGKMENLSPRELEVMDLFVTGKSSKMIAYELGISQKTSDFHRANILKKMSVESVVKLMPLAQKAGRI